MKISLLSVAPPFRGGISDQTHYLYEKLESNHSVNIVNFKRQYPKILFPGKTQYKSSLNSLDSQNHRIIDSINPFSWLRAVKFLKDCSPDLIVLRFWNPFFAVCHAFIIKRIKKYLNNVKVICICDNIKPHEKHFYDRLLVSNLFRHVDGFIVMSEKVEEELIDIVDKPLYKKLFHPIIPGSSIPSKQESRATLGLSKKKIIMFFGLVRSYKGLDVLIKANKLLKTKLSDYQILICGESYGDDAYYLELIKNNSDNEEVRWINKFIPSNEVATYFSASDVVALPYKTASQSGIIPLAYSFLRPVIASDIKGIREMVLEGETGTLFQMDSPESLSTKIKHFFDEDIDYEDNIKNFRTKFSWNSFVDEIESLYKCLK